MMLLARPVNAALTKKRNPKKQRAGNVRLEVQGSCRVPLRRANRALMTGYRGWPAGGDRQILMDSDFCSGVY
jgi:hypothetical protein